jgi:protoporphyrinogen oxidase
MKRAIIIGAGPAGLTAAYELLTRSDIVPVVLEKSTYMGGISRTVNYKGNRMDIGGHRFFSKSDRVMSWWLQHMPIQRLAAANANGSSNGNGAAGLKITYHQASRDVDSRAEAPDPARTDTVMLVRSRKSRIYFLRKFFDYPISLSKNTLTNLGIIRTLKIGCSYIRSAVFPVRNEKNLEEFFINRFGRELYKTFFKSYTEKVWGVPCDQISAEWGAQRIKGLSVTKTLTHMLKKAFGRRNPQDVAQKDTETSLIEQFLYPKFGPGQMWEIVAKKVEQMGGQIITGFDVTGLQCDGNRVRAVRGVDSSGAEREFRGDYFFSTMPVKELVNALDSDVPSNVQEVSNGLMYRDFITVGLLLNKLKVSGSVKRKAAGNAQGRSVNRLIDDNWIYIQEPEVRAGRLQIFNNWSPHLVVNPDQVWIGVEYFCYEGDDLWTKTDAEMSEFARQELATIGVIEPDAVLDSTVIRMPKTYPAYFGAYARFDEIRQYLDGFENLFLVGRNGMHKYNNQDHSMLTAMIAVDNIIEGRTEKSNLWDVNTEMEYHETKESQPAGNVTVSAAADKN